MWTLVFKNLFIILYIKALGSGPVLRSDVPNGEPDVGFANIPGNGFKHIIDGFGSVLSGDDRNPIFLWILL